MNRDLVLLQVCLEQIRHAPPSRVNSSPERLLQMYYDGASIGHGFDTDAGCLTKFWLRGDTKQLLETATAIANRQPS